MKTTQTKTQAKIKTSKEVSREKHLAKKASKVEASKKTAKTSKTTKVVEAVAKVKGETIGAFTKVLILQGMAVNDIATQIKEKFPNCGPQINSIYYYRSQLHKSGELAKA